MDIDKSDIMIFIANNQALDAHKGEQACTCEQTEDVGVAFLLANSFYKCLICIPV